ncbi:similar to Saccharomyces cerevisiae YPL169C MEX67 Poly(A)RNA binding protein involved in nuclear mRNA export, component of the nuclear pore [Maudiozyma barnettii]|nr:similar to Saccharomyces cerevisiae YPL169C MEX67 Poly(A)RNA binding protein involved in nuclear mRNA export, component of the nuclear pore [Kazachstania barnettii]
MNNFHNVNNIGMVAQQQNMQNRIKIGVRNWQNATMQDLLNFISRNARVTLSNASIEGPLIVGYVQSKDQSDSIMKWNGANFAGNKLKFELLDGQGGTSNTIEFLRQFIINRYDPQTKMLNLGGLAQDPILIQKGMFNNLSTQSRMFPAMMKVASKEPQLIVESVNLADNKLKDINVVSSLPQSFPNLKNLCLANNQIMRLNSLESWKNKFKNLRELLMTNNPITSNNSYRSEMLRVFPKLAILDNVMVRDAAKLDSIFNFPIKLQQFYFENDQLGQSSTDFVTNFLNFWDSDRSQLLNLYSPQSQFSVSANTSVPASTIKDADQNASFGYYLPHSRNIAKMSSEKSIEQRLAIGQEQINTLFQSLPKTKHALLNDPNGYSMETIAYPQVNGYMVILHGYFEETDKPDIVPNSKTTSRGKRYGSHTPANNRLCKKSFDRIWVIVPMNNTFVVASDELTVRSYTSNTWSQPAAPALVAPAATPSAVPVGIPTAPMNNMTAMNPGLVQGGVPALAPTLQLPPDVQARLTPVQLELLNKLHLQTKLNAEYSYMLAEQSGWNYDNALKAFQASVQNLPREAFIQ